MKLATRPGPDGRFPLVAVMVLGAIGMCASLSHAQCSYEAEVMPWPAGYHTVAAKDMNESGVIVGWRRLQGGSLLQSAFRWSSEEGYITLPAPPIGAAAWEATRIDAEGNIAGGVDVPGPPNLFLEIVRWPSAERGGGVQLLSAGDSTKSYAIFGLLSDGSTVGYIQNSVAQDYPRPFYWRDGGFLTFPEPLASSTFAQFTCVHPSGWAGGGMGVPTPVPTEYFSVLWHPGGEVQVIDLLPSPQYGIERIAALDRHGRACILAYAFVPRVFGVVLRSFYWNGSELTPIGPNQGAEYTTGAGMNELGQIIGRTGVVGGVAGLTYPFIWQNGRFTDLRTLTTLPANVTLSWGLKPLNNGMLFCEARLNNNAIGVILRPQTTAEDINVDCAVDALDIAFVFEEWGQVDAFTVRRADVNGDGSVDAHDLGAVLGAWSPR